MWVSPGSLQGAFLGGLGSTVTAGPWLHVLQNSGSSMFMLRVKTLSAQGNHWPNFKRNKYRVQQYRRAHFSPEGPSATQNGQVAAEEFQCPAGFLGKKDIVYWYSYLANLNWLFACWIFVWNSPSQILRPDRIHQNFWMQTCGVEIFSLCTLTFFAQCSSSWSLTSKNETWELGI